MLPLKGPALRRILLLLGTAAMCGTLFAIDTDGFRITPRAFLPELSTHRVPFRGLSSSPNTHILLHTFACHPGVVPPFPSPWSSNRCFIPSPRVAPPLGPPARPSRACRAGSGHHGSVPIPRSRLARSPRRSRGPPSPAASAARTHAVGAWRSGWPASRPSVARARSRRRVLHGPAPRETPHAPSGRPGSGIADHRTHNRYGRHHPRQDGGIFHSDRHAHWYQNPAPASAAERARSWTNSRTRRGRNTPGSRYPVDRA